MFGLRMRGTRPNELYEQIEKLERERDELTDRNTELKNEILTLKHQKKIEEEDIKHMVRMKEEALELAHDRKMLECERERDKAIAETKDEYRDKVEKGLSEQLENMRGMYDKVLERLPNVSARLKGEL